MKKTGEWSSPINLGPPVNTPYRELGFFLSADGKTGFFASDRPDGQGGMDIYRFQLSKQLHSDPITFVEGYVRDSVILTPVQATVGINGRSPAFTDESGRFFLCVGADEVLDLEVVDTKGYKPFHNQFAIPEWNNKYFYTIELLLQPTISFINNDLPIVTPPTDSTLIPEPNISETVHRHTVYHPFDDYVLTSEEISRLDAFLKDLGDLEVIRVEVIGFADDVGADFYNLRLSEKRAKQAALYLIDQGFVVDQIYLEGKGEVTTHSEKSKNRRVEIKIISQK